MKVVYGCGNSRNSNISGKDNVLITRTRAETKRIKTKIAVGEITKPGRRRRLERNGVRERRGGGGGGGGKC